MVDVVFVENMWFVSGALRIDAVQTCLKHVVHLFRIKWLALGGHVLDQVVFGVIALLVHIEDLQGLVQLVLIGRPKSSMK